MVHTATKLILVRHGEVEGGPRLLGHADPQLSMKGRATLAATARRLVDEKIDALYSSDLIRTVESARIIAEGREVAHRKVPALRELDMGEWDGRTISEVRASDRERIGKWWDDPVNYATPGGESLGNLRERVVPALEEILKAHPGQTVCLVAHGGTNRVVLFETLGLSLAKYYTVSQDYGCINRLRYFEDGMGVVDLING